MHPLEEKLDYPFKNAIRQGMELAQSGLIDDITANIGYMRLGEEKKSEEKVEKL